MRGGYLLILILVLVACKTVNQKDSQPSQAQFLKRIADNDGIHFDIEVPGSPGAHVLSVCPEKGSCQELFVNEETISLKSIPAGSYKVDLRACTKGIEAVCDQQIFAGSFIQPIEQAKQSITGDSEYQILVAKNDASLQFYAAIFRHYTAVTLCKSQGKLDENLKEYYDFLAEMAQLGPVLGTVSINAIFAEDANSVASLKTSLGAELTGKEAKYRVTVINYAEQPVKRKVFTKGSWRVNWVELFLKIYPASAAHSSFFIEKFENGRWTTEFYFSFPARNDFNSDRPDYADRDERRTMFNLPGGEESVIKFKEWLRKSDYAPTPNAILDQLKEERKKAKIDIGQLLNNAEEMKTFSRKYKNLIKKGHTAFKDYVAAQEAVDKVKKGKRLRYLYDGEYSDRFPAEDKIKDIYRQQALGKGSETLDKELKALLAEERKALVLFEYDKNAEGLLKDSDYGDYDKMAKARESAFKNTWFSGFKSYQAFASKEGDKAVKAIALLQDYMIAETRTTYFQTNRQTSEEDRQYLQKRLYAIEKIIKREFLISEKDSLRRYFGYDGDLWRMAPPEVIIKDVHGFDILTDAGKDQFKEEFKRTLGKDLGDFKKWYDSFENVLIKEYEKAAAELHPKTKAYGANYDGISNNCSKGAARALNQLTGTKYFLKSTDKIMTPGKLANRAQGFDAYMQNKASKKVMTPANLGLAALVALTSYTIIDQAAVAALTDGGDTAAMQCFADDKETFNDEITDVFDEMSRIRTGQALSEQMQNFIR